MEMEAVHLSRREEETTLGQETCVLVNIKLVVN